MSNDKRIPKRVKGLTANTEKIMFDLRTLRPKRKSALTRAWNEQARRYGVSRSGRLRRGFRVKQLRSLPVR